MSRYNNEAPDNGKKLSIILAAAAVVITAVCVVVFSFHERNETVPAISHPPDTENKEPGGAVYAEGEFIDYLGQSVPVLADVDKNSYDFDAFAFDGDVMSYSANGKTGILGVDVSSFQEDADWSAFKNAGVEFAMIRVGYRGYTEGKLCIDNEFHTFMRGAADAGLKLGIYFYSQATSVAEAEEEARQVLEWISRYKDEITYPVVYDWERVNDGRTAETDGGTITACCVAFCDIIADAGYTPMVYFNLDMGYLYYDLSAVDQYDFWLAEYDGAPTFYYDFDMLQYTGYGRLPGFDGHIDLNLSFVDYSNKSR